MEGTAAKALRLEQIGLFEEKKNLCVWHRVRSGGGGRWDGRGRQDRVGRRRKERSVQRAGACLAGLICSEKWPPWGEASSGRARAGARLGRGPGEWVTVGGTSWWWYRWGDGDHLVHNMLE